MEYLRRNLGTLSLLAFAIGAFLTELAKALPEGYGAKVAAAALVSMAIGRAIVLAAQALSPYHDSDGSGQVLMFPAKNEGDA